MKIRLPFAFFSPTCSADIEYASGVRDLNDRSARKALRHFKRAVSKNPRLDADAAELCLSKQRPKLALKILGECTSRPSSPLDLDLSARRMSIRANAHRALAHASDGSFREKHGSFEIACLENIVGRKANYTETHARYSTALAELYCHRQFGVCFTRIRQGKRQRAASHDDWVLFGTLMQAAYIRLARGDVSALDVIENFFDKGPPNHEHPEVLGTLQQLHKTLGQFAALASEGHRVRAQAVMDALESRGLYYKH